MVLEYLLTPKSARHEPYKLLPATMLFYSAGVAVYLLIPGITASPIVFTLIPLLPLMLRLLLWEEKSEEEGFRRSSGFFAYHGLLLESFAFVFVGAMLASTFWYAVLPPDAAAHAFSEQVKEIALIKGAVNSGSAGTGNVLRPEFFTFLSAHNLQVLALMFLFSLLYGVGSLYLLLWNASILGVFTATKMAQSASQTGVPGIITGFFGAFAGLLPHGMFEVSAYFVASIAGGIFSIAVMRRDMSRPELVKIVLDVAFLAAVSVVLLLIGAVIESSY
jgi:uncharacterized membrane protein SpoIIM required for sporulation